MHKSYSNGENYKTDRRRTETTSYEALPTRLADRITDCSQQVGGEGEEAGVGQVTLRRPPRPPGAALCPVASETLDAQHVVGHRRATGGATERVEAGRHGAGGAEGVARRATACTRHARRLNNLNGIDYLPPTTEPFFKRLSCQIASYIIHVKHTSIVLIKSWGIFSQLMLYNFILINVFNKFFMKIFYQR